MNHSPPFKLLALLALALTLLATGPRAAHAQAIELDHQRLQANYDALTSQPHRLAGSPAGRAAGDRIIAQLRALGVTDENLQVHEFPMTQLAGGDAHSGQVYFERDGERDGERHAMHPLRPNGLALPVTPAEGLAGPSVYLGDGHWEHFANREVQGRIAVMDWDSDDRWQRALGQGAVAILFVGPVEAQEGERKWLYSNTPLPRFFVERDVAEAAGLFEDGTNIRLFSRLDFEQTRGRNIFALIPGTDPAQAKRVVGLAVSYDTFGAMPWLAPGTRQAANVAGLIEAAAHFQANPLSRPVLLAFFDAGGQDGLGQLMFQYARAHYRGSNEANSLTRLILNLEDEQKYLQTTEAALADPVAVIEGTSSSPGASEEQQQLRRFFEQVYNDLSDQRMRLSMRVASYEQDVIRSRQALAHFEARVERGEADDVEVTRAFLRARLEQAEARQARELPLIEPRIAALTAERAKVAGVRRDENEKRVQPENLDKFHEMVAQRVAWVSGRLAELQESIIDLQQHQALGAWVAPMELSTFVFVDLLPGETSWTLTIPSSMDLTTRNWSRGSQAWSSSSEVLATVARGQLTNWVQRLEDDPQLRERWPGYGGSPLNVKPETPYQWRVIGAGHYVLAAGNLGAVWPGRGLPTEPTADLGAFASRFGEFLDFFGRFGQHEDIASIPLTQARSVPSHYFRNSEWQSNQRVYDSNVVQRYGGGQVQADLPEPNAVVLIRPLGRATAPIEADREWGHYVTATRHGTFTVMGDGSYQAYLHAVRLNDQGAIVGINEHEPGGLMGFVGRWDSPGYFSLRERNRLALFEAVPLNFWQTWRPFYESKGAGEVRVLQAVNDVPFDRLHLTQDGFIGTAWLGEPQDYKLANGALLMLNNRPIDPIGMGYQPEPGMRDLYEFGAHDTWVLNESRLGSLRVYGIIQNELERLHARAEQYLEAADALASTAPGDANAHRAASLSNSAGAYQPVRDVTNDLIKAVVILLLLAVPFSMAIERLLFGSPNIYKQIGAFTGTFLVVFVILFLVHPAFRFATAPIVVLLAFVIIIMSAFVIWIMWGRFEHEVKNMQGIATASHRSTRNHRNTIAAAVSLGISTMRRRPLRTLLTAITIVLLTFTVLFFGSFTAEGGVRKIFMGPSSGPPMVEAALPGGKGLSPHTVETLSRLWADEADVFVRRWSVGEGETAMVGRDAQDGLFTVGAWATVPPRDFDLAPALYDSMDGDLEGFRTEGGLMLPQRLATELNVQVGDTLTFQRRTWVYRGAFDPLKVQSIRTLQGASFIPPDIERTRRLLAQQNPGDSQTQDQKLTEMELSAFPLIDPASVVLLWDPADRLPSPAYSLVLLPRTDRQADRIAQEIATMMGGRVTVSADGQVQRVLYSQQLSLAGMSKLAVPLLLGGLIIFSTMLSSVSDREREIFTFSALGLAPTHVAVLFFAEAAVYAVLGGMGGYLFSQIFGKIVEGLAGLGLVTAPAMNYSSMNAMVAILIVMATVLVSTIYPAYKASRSANPGVQRRWKMPPAEGDHYEIRFPFTVSVYDLVGLISYLEEYFNAHQDRTVGSFAANHVEIHRVEHMFELSATIWLQPFDQGVSQTFRLRTTPSDIEGINEVHIAMHRLSGPPVIWERSNKVFIHDIREQFIFWRTIGEEMQDHYHEATLERFGARSTEQLLGTVAAPGAATTPAGAVPAKASSTSSSAAGGEAGAS